MIHYLLCIEPETVQGLKLKTGGIGTRGQARKLNLGDPGEAGGAAAEAGGQRKAPVSTWGATGRGLG